MGGSRKPPHQNLRFRYWNFHEGVIRLGQRKMSAPVSYSGNPPGALKL